MCKRTTCGPCILRAKIDRGNVEIRNVVFAKIRQKLLLADAKSVKG